MRDILPSFSSWLEDGTPLAIATVISTWGSAPRRPGSMMVVTGDGQMAGSVSGGCVEGALIQAAQKAIRTEQAELLHFGVADETAWDVGLACGGKLDVFVQPVSDPNFWKTAIAEDQKDKPIWLVTAIKSDNHLASTALVDEGGHTIASTADITFPIVNSGQTQPRVNTIGKEDFFINPLLPAPKLVLIGGVHIAIALSSLASTAGFQSVIVDPRKTFGAKDRFPYAAELIQEWPQGALSNISITNSVAIVTLSHDPKIDDPALSEAVTSSAFYIGALGSAKTHEQRLARLRSKGFSEAQLARIQGPVGLEIGAETPEEIAVAILAQIIQARRSSIAKS